MLLDIHARRPAGGPGAYLGAVDLVPIRGEKTPNAVVAYQGREYRVMTGVRPFIVVEVDPK